MELTNDDIERAKRSPVDFGEVCSGGWYNSARHLQLLNEKLKRIERGELKRLMIFMPPQHGKSETVTHFFTDWYLGLHPEENIAVCCYNADWAEHWGQETRDTFKEYGPRIYGYDVRQDSKSVGTWRIAGHRGGVRATGIGGSLTGRRVNGLIMEDPVKDAQEAWSKTVQGRNAAWYRSTARTRLSPDGWQILIMTRWHKDDLAGQILSDGIEEWEVLELPAIAGADDEMGRKAGEALWPEQYDTEKLLAIRGPDEREYYWLAMYQQQPSVPDGLLFFDPFAVERGRAKAIPPAERIETRPMPGQPADGYILVWERPQTNEAYYIGADTADGKAEPIGTWKAHGGPDRNSAVIYRASDDRQVAGIYGRQEEHRYAAVLNEWGRSYNNALLAVERNRRATVVALRQLEYPNLFYPTMDEQLHVLPKDKISRVEYGWDTNVKTRPILMADIREVVSTGSATILDADFWLECDTFIEGDPPQAMPGCKDDRILAHAIARQARKALRAMRRPAPSVGSRTLKFPARKQATSKGGRA